MVGILRRSAEGQIKHFFAIFGAILAVGLWMPFLSSRIKIAGSNIFLPDLLGWESALAVTITFLAAFYFVVTVTDGKRPEKS